MPTSILTSKGQITIPKRIREELRLQTGDELLMEIDSNSNITLKPIKKSADEAFGLLYRKEQEPLSVEEMDSRVSEYFRQKYKAK